MRWIPLLLLSAVIGMGMGRQPKDPYKTFPVHVEVDFGPAGREGYDGVLFVEKGTNLTEAVSQIYPVLLGKSCCSVREVLEIDGVRVDPAQNYWWKVSVNDSQDVSPRKTALEKGDRLRWFYLEEIK